MIQQQPTDEQATTRDTAPVAISLFGTFALAVNGESVTNFRSNKTRALLIYLLLTDAQPLPRTTISELLWAGYVEQSAQTNLRQAVANLRSCLAPVELLQSSRTQLSLLRDPTLLWCDVYQFEALIDACYHHEHRMMAACLTCRTRLQQAVALYKAPLLETFTALDSQPFNVWLSAQRTRLAARLAEAQAILAAGSTTPGNLPPLLTPLVGRTHELVELERNLRHTVYRCVTLVGPGGIGKTHLACALGARMQSHFPDGVWLVELSGLPPPQAEDAPALVYDRLAVAIAQAMGLNFYGAAAPTTQLAHYLTDKAALLILDSFEHLRVGAGWLPPLLTAAPRLQLLVTTRQRLPLKSQVVYGVEGLGVPPEEATNGRAATHLLAQYTSVQLFVERAASAGLTLPVDRATLATVGQLCRFVEGSPWAIELAVALLDQHSPAAILTAIQHNYRALTTNWLDVPLRQRSAEAVFLTTWRLLTPTEAQTLACCAVFRGGFTLDVAQTVAGATQATLDALVQKSLLQLSSAQRYTLHDLVRQFAGEQLALDDAAHHATQAAHAAYFITLLATWRPDDATEQRFRRAVTQDWENVQAAWAWAAASGQVALLQQGVDGLAEFYEIAGLYLDAARTLGQTSAQVRLLQSAGPPGAPAPTAADRAVQQLQAHLLRRRSHFLSAGLGQIAEAQALAEEVLALGEALADEGLRAWGYYELAIVALLQGDYGRQAHLLQQALTLAAHQGDQRAQAYYLVLLGISGKMQRNYAAARHTFETALTLAQTIGSSRLALLVLQNLGSFHWEAGHFTEANRALQHALNRAQQLAQKDSATFATAVLGALACTLGDYATARAYLTKAQQSFVELGDNVLAAQTLNALATLAIEVGDMAAAADYTERALRLPVAAVYYLQLAALMNQGQIHQKAGNWHAARTAYAAALALSQQHHQLSEQLPVQAYLAALDLAQGELTAARTAIEPVITHVAATTFSAEQRPQEFLLIAYRILVAAADPRAPALLTQAWALVQEQLAQIDDPRLRQTFLTKVPVNRALAQLVG